MTPTAEQEKIYNFIKYDSNHGIIDAVAGSGKTTTIIESIGFVDKDKSLLFCAFNKSIRDEIHNRISEKGYDNIVVKNLHQLGFDILKSNSEIDYNVDINKFDKIISNSIKSDLEYELKKYLKLYGVNIEPKDSFEESILKNNINSFKNKLTDSVNKIRLTLTKDSFQEFKEMIIHFGIIDVSKTGVEILDKVIDIILKCTLQVLEIGNLKAKKINSIDLTDMLYLPKYFELYPKKTYDILFVDECQDLSKAQLAIALKYVRKNGRVIAVGDPYQSIYGFTGADIESFSRFERLLKNHNKLSLSFCFRCPNNVIEYAQNFREDIKPFTEKEGIIEKIDFHQVTNLANNSDLIISRTKAPLTSLLFVLLESNKKVNIHQDDINDLFNELRFLFSKEELNTINVFRNGYDFFEKIKDRNIYFVENNAKKMSNASQKEEYIKDETDYVIRRINFLQRQSSIHIDVRTINELIKRIENLVTESDEAIKLSTIHKAKGLENKRVFILDYDKLPMKKDGHKPWETIQENNLKYVALTRTKHTLYLVNSIKEETPTEDGNLYDELEDIW